MNEAKCITVTSVCNSLIRVALSQKVKTSAAQLCAATSWYLTLSWHAFVAHISQGTQAVCCCTVCHCECVLCVVLSLNLLVHRQYAEEHQINEELRKLLPRDEGKPIEKPAERALRERM